MLCEVKILLQYFFHLMQFCYISTSTEIFFKFPFLNKYFKALKTGVLLNFFLFSFHLNGMNGYLSSMSVRAFKMRQNKREKST